MSRTDSLKIITSKIKPTVYEALKKRAEENHRSMSAEVSQILTEILVEK